MQKHAYQMKKSYHTDLAIQHKLGMLSLCEKESIPKSTLYSWKCRDFSKMIGGETAFSDEKLELIKTFLANQTLLRAAKGLFFVYSVWVSFAMNLRGMKTTLRKNKDIIVKTIDKIIPLMGLKHACKLFKISQTQFYAWKRKITCALSPLNSCLKANVFNVSPSELEVMKNCLQEERYKYYPLTAVYYEMMRRGMAFMSLTTFTNMPNYLTPQPTVNYSKPNQKRVFVRKTPKRLFTPTCAFTVRWIIPSASSILL